ncbi:MAG: InlB B-repeat-containing protein [Peptococcaceae bacterium]|nr:InlB B-repeat-containing protein [Peptococcaceae bacterium]
MNQKMRKMLSILLVFAMLFSIMPVSAFAAGDEVYYGIKVCGVDVTSANADDVLGDGTVWFDAETFTLTLNNAVLDVEGNAIHAEFEEETVLTIHGEGENSIHARYVIVEGEDEDGPYTSYEDGYGIFIQSNGSLILTGCLGDITADEDAINGIQGVCIDGTVGNITSGSDAITAAFGDVVINGSVGNITAENDWGSGNGISADNVVITGQTGDITAGMSGIQSTDGDVTITGTVGSITGGANGIEAYFAWDFDEEDNYVPAGGGNVTISSTGIISGAAYGVYTDGTLEIATTASSLVFNGNEAAIAAGGGIGRTDVIITEPADYSLGSIFIGYSDEEELWYTTYGAYDDEVNFTPATTVKFEPGYWVYFDVEEVYIEEQEVLAGGKAVKPADPVRDGYAFGGWYLDSEYTEVYDFDTPVTENLWLYGKWDKVYSGGGGYSGTYIPPVKYDTTITMQIGSTNINADGKMITNDVAPVIVGDRTMVPVRVITELLGGKVDWNDAARTVTLTIDGKVLSMTIGKEIPGYGTSATIINDRTYVPVRYIMEELGANVEWNAETQQIVIEK